MKDKAVVGGVYEIKERRGCDATRNPEVVYLRVDILNSDGVNMSYSGLTKAMVKLASCSGCIKVSDLGTRVDISMKDANFGVSAVGEVILFKTRGEAEKYLGELVDNPNVCNDGILMFEIGERWTVKIPYKFKIVPRSK